MSESLRAGWHRALWGRGAPRNGLLAFLLALMPLRRTLGENLRGTWQFGACNATTCVTSGVGSSPDELSTPGTRGGREHGRGHHPRHGVQDGRVQGSAASR